jgi:hypothetical protein
MNVKRNYAAIRRNNRKEFIASCLVVVGYALQLLGFVAILSAMVLVYVMLA